MKTILGVFATLVSLLVGSSLQAMEPWGVLDEFSGDIIDDEIWDTTASMTTGIIGIAREQAEGKLRLYNRTHADLAPVGEQRPTRLRLVARNSEDISQIRTRMKVVRADVTTCDDPNEVSSVRGRIVGYFFKNGPQSGADIDATNDIFTALGVWRDSTSADLKISAHVESCDNPNCSSTTPYLFDDTTLGTLELDEYVRLSVRWDAENDRLIFSRDGQRLVYNYGGILTDENPPEYRWNFVGKRIGVSTSISNCTSGPRGEGLMEIQARSFVVNQSAAAPDVPDE